MNFKSSNNFNQHSGNFGNSNEIEEAKETMES